VAVVRGRGSDQAHTHGILQAAMPVIAGRKSKLESFAGANVTYTIEAMMSDRKALQVRPRAVRACVREASSRA
jgi:prolyl-tRNA synthetase